MTGRGAQRVTRRFLLLLAMAIEPLSAVVVHASDTPAMMLYNQILLRSTGAAAAQDFETKRNGRDCQAADGVTVPVGARWLVQQVFLKGSYGGDGVSVAAVHIRFAFDDGGRPGVAVCATTGTVVRDLAGDLTLELVPPCQLDSGVVWLEVVAELAYGTGNLEPGRQWYWEWSDTPVGNHAMWRNPNLGFPTQCQDWGTLPDCFATEAVSFRFALSGIPLAADLLFADGFELSDTSAWSSAVP